MAEETKEAASAAVPDSAAKPNEEVKNQDAAKTAETDQAAPNPPSADNSAPAPAQPVADTPAPETTPQPDKSNEDSSIETKEYWVIGINKGMIIKIVLPLVLVIGLVLAYFFVPAVHNLL